MDPACAVMVERVIGFHGLLAFVVDNKEDELLLRQELRRNLNLKVDISTVTHKDPVRPPYNQELLYQLKQDIGVQGYLSDQMKTPDLIRAHLFMWRNVGGVLWARGENISEKFGLSHSVSLCPSGINSFTIFVHNISNQNMSRMSMSTSNDSSTLDIVEFSGKKSRYHSGPPSTGSNSVKPLSILGGGTNDSDTNIRKKELEYEINNYQQEQEEILLLLEKKREHLRSLENKKLNLQGEKEHLQPILRLPNSIQHKINSEQKKINDLENILSKDSTVEKKRKLLSLENNINKYLNSIAKCVQISEENINNLILKKAAETAHIRYGNVVLKAVQALREANEGLKSLRDAIQVAEDVYKEANAKCILSDNNLNTYMQSLGGGSQFDTLYEKAIRTCPEKNLEEIKLRMDQIEDEVHTAIDNPHIVQRYEETVRLKSIADDELLQLQREHANSEENLQVRSSNWLSTVENLATQLNESFSKFMSELSYSGEVSLVKKGMFKDYEMQMKVRFRVESPMSVLSGLRHSGGERAVATVMYLMALQDITDSPFRVVDEINQGMDERNERLVFDQIVQSCCHDPSDQQNRLRESHLDSSTLRHNKNNNHKNNLSMVTSKNRPQYFLVSPKLLQGLRAMENNQITILLVWNGPGIMSKWQLPEIIRNLKRKYSADISNGYSDDEEEDDANKLKKKKILPPKSMPK